MSLKHGGLPPTAPRIGTKDMLMVLAVAEHASFIGAAAHLKTSQPIVTRSIKRIEQILGVALFQRNTRRVEITLAGRAFVAVAERALNDLQNTVRSMDESATEQRRRLTISTFSTFAAHRLPDLIRQFRASRPHIEVRVREGRQSEIVEDVRTGIADFGVGYVDSLPDTLSKSLLRREPLHVVMPVSHRLAAKKPQRLRLDDIRSEALVSPPSETYLRRVVDGAAAGRGFALRHHVVVDSMVSVVYQVEAGVGVGILPAGALPPPPWHQFHAALLVEPSLAVSVGVITAPGRYLPPSTASMITLIADGVDAPELWPIAK